MGLDAAVIAIGPFAPAVADAMEYGPAFHDRVKLGETVVTHVFVACTSDDSHALAAAFAAGAMELGKHRLDASRADLAQLTALFGDRDVAQFTTLRDNGFDFFFLPNA